VDEKMRYTTAARMNNPPMMNLERPMKQPPT
jgi:hypothetical protein